MNLSDAKKVLEEELKNIQEMIDAFKPAAPTPYFIELQQALSFYLSLCEKLSVENLENIIANIETQANFKIGKGMDKDSIVFLINKEVSKQLAQAILTEIGG